MALNVTQICYSILSVATVFLCGICGLSLSHKPNLAIVNMIVDISHDTYSASGIDYQTICKIYIFSEEHVNRIVSNRWTEKEIQKDYVKNNTLYV